MRQFGDFLLFRVNALGFLHCFNTVAGCLVAGMCPAHEKPVPLIPKGSGPKCGGT